jgi:hypothetical protein
LRHPWITRDLKAKPPLTKSENMKNMGEELMIETKLRKVMIDSINVLAVTNGFLPLYNQAEECR